ncbi:hypothetical protein Esti_004095 [Eimeria stiedai]
MKGRWRKDKRATNGGGGAGEESGGKGGSHANAVDLQNFTFTAASKAHADLRGCLEDAHASLVRSEFAMCDGQTHDDFMKALTGGSICIPSFFDSRESNLIFNSLLEELKEYDMSQEASSTEAAGEAAADSQEKLSSVLPVNGLCRWSKHLKHENPEAFPTFQKVVHRLSQHFDLEIYATRMNIYPDGSHWKPHHHDSHAYSFVKNQAEDFTVGASFGSQRLLEFAHVKSGIRFSFPQANGSIFAFNSLVNKTFTHGVPAEPKDAVGPRISIIVAAACYSGNLKQLAPYDLNADFCGSKVVGEERQYLYYPDPYNPTNGICVESCPTAEWTGTINIPDGLGGITVHPVSSSELVLGQYCFQPRMKSKEILTSLHEKRPFLYSIVQDVFKATEVLFATVFISIVLAVVGIKAMLNKRSGRNVSLATSFAPCFVAMAIVLLTLYHFFTPRVVAPGISLLVLACVLAAASFSTGAIPIVFPKTYARSRQLMLVGAQALEEMPDVMTFVIMTSAGIGATVIWNIWICASLLTMGRAVPEPLVVDSHAEVYMGIMTSFTRKPGQGLACLIVFVTFVLQFESAIVFTKFLTTRCVKKWFEKLPRNGHRDPRCDYLIPACTDVPKDWGPLGAATFFAPICRIPANLMQMLASESALAPHTDTLATYLQRRLIYFNDCRKLEFNLRQRKSRRQSEPTAVLFNNQLLPSKLDDANSGFLEAALAGYLELTQGKVDDHYSARRYAVQELLSPAFQVGFFSTMSIFVAMITWITLEWAPIFNHTGQKALDSVPVVVLIAFTMSALVLAVFREAINAAACAAVMLWSKAASDVLWCNAINSVSLASAVKK